MSNSALAALRHHVTAAIERGEKQPIVAMEQSHAEIVRDLILAHSPVAITLSMGYMVTRGNNRVNFSDHYGNRAWDTPRIIGEKRNKAGRCTSLIAVYSDSSRLRFTWSDKMGARYRVIGVTRMTSIAKE